MKQSKLIIQDNLISCPSCKKLMSPLSYIDGSYYCSICKKDMLADNFKITPTAENEKFFSLSQSNMLYYIKAQKAKDGEEIKEHSHYYLTRALDYCRKSAFSGNPKALMNLAFYYEQGYDPSAINSAKFIEKCYQTIIVSEANDDMKKFAKTNLDRFREQQKLNRMLNSSPTKSNMDFLENLITFNNNSIQAPLFGIFSIYKPKDEDAYADLDKKLHKLFYSCKKKLFVMSDADGSFSILEKIKDLSGDNEDIYFGKDNRCWIAFYNQSHKCDIVNGTLINQVLSNSKSKKDIFSLSGSNQVASWFVECVSLAKEQKIEGYLFKESDVFKNVDSASSYNELLGKLLESISR